MNGLFVTYSLSSRLTNPACKTGIKEIKLTMINKGNIQPGTAIFFLDPGGRWTCFSFFVFFSCDLFSWEPLFFVAIEFSNITYSSFCPVSLLAMTGIHQEELCP